MRVNHIMLCDFAIPAAGAQKASIIGIFQAFNLPELPFRVPRFFIVFEVEGESAETGKFDVAVLLRDGDGRDLFALKGQLDAPKTEPGRKWRANHLIEVENLQVKRPGGHQVLVLLNREKKAETGLQVNLKSTPQP